MEDKYNVNAANEAYRDEHDLKNDDEYREALDLDGDDKKSDWEINLFMNGINTYEDYANFIFTADTNGDGKIDKGESKDALKRIDANKNGKYEDDELMRNTEPQFHNALDSENTSQTK